MNFFSFLTPVTYWILIILWTYILYFYINRLRSDLSEDKLFYVLFIILSIDAFRTLFESCYFGAWYTSLAGFIPIEIHTFLVRPEMVFIPKIINVIAAMIVIIILLFRWIPHETTALSSLKQLVDEKTSELNQEISSRINAEDNLKQYTKNLETIFNNTHNILVLINEDVRVEMINNRGTDFTNKTQDEAFGRLGGEVFNCINAFEGKGCGNHPDCAACPVRTLIIDTFETGINYKDKKGEMILLVNESCRLFHILISTSLVEIDGNRKVLLAITDNTEHVLAEKTIRESDQRFEKVFNSHLDAILLLNADIPPKIIAVNEAAEKILGYQSDELIGKTTELLHIDASHLEKFKKALEFEMNSKGYMSDFEFFMRRKDGKRFVSGHKVVELKNDEDKRTGWVSIVRDLTERNKLQEYLQQSQRMEAIGNLASGIAHDFNNILFPIIGMSDLLLEDLPPESSNYENAQTINTAGRRGSELVNQILSFSRQSKNKVSVIKVQSILKEAYKLARATIPTNIEMKRDVQKDCETVLGDPTHIHQVMMNLVTNAYHAIETVKTEGKIEIVLKQISGEKHDTEKVALKNGECLLFKVSDNGCGIKNELMGKLFEPYFTTKEKGKGTGLGLAVVFGIVKEHGGEIKVQSKENKGTSISIYLPLAGENSKTDEQDITIPAVQHGTEKILLIDDEEPIAKLCKQMLERLGYQVSICTSSSDALDQFRDAPDYFDLVISDLSMPSMTGYQLSEELFKINPEIPIIICTGFSDKIDENITGLIGIKACLKKPLVKSEMGQMIRKILDS